MDDLRLAFLGFGNAGRAVARMIVEKQDDIKEKYGRGIVVTAIATKTRGTILNEKGIDLLKAVKDVEEEGKFASNTPGLCDLDNFQVIEKGEYDVLCELTPLNIFTGQPAIDHIKAAFNRGKHVITANKGPIAWAYSELKKMADEKGLMFFHETVVMDGTPIFNLAEHTLKLCKVKEVSGILNSTTNFILEEMAKDVPYEEIMRRGRELGFVEADPAMDIEGYDAAAKVTALINVLMNGNITPDMVKRQGIENITREDIKKAEAKGKVIKLLCRGVLKEDGSVEAEVKPVEVDKTDMLASVNSTTSVVSIVTDLMGKISITSHEPEIQQTAYGVFGDALRVLEGIK